MISLSRTIWESTGGCAEQYHCAKAPFILSCLVYSSNARIYHAVSVPGNGKYAAYDINVIDKIFLIYMMDKPKFLNYRITIT